MVGWCFPSKKHGARQDLVIIFAMGKTRRSGVGYHSNKISIPIFWSVPSASNQLSRVSTLTDVRETVGMLTSFRQGEFTKSIHQRQFTHYRCIWPRLEKWASKKEGDSAYPHLLSVRFVRSVKRFCRAWPLWSARNGQNSILRKTQLRQAWETHQALTGLDLRVCSMKGVQGSGPHSHRSLECIWAESYAAECENVAVPNKISIQYTVDVTLFFWQDIETQTASQILLCKMA